MKIKNWEYIGYNADGPGYKCLRCGHIFSSWETITTGDICPECETPKYEEAQAPASAEEIKQRIEDLKYTRQIDSVIEFAKAHRDFCKTFEHDECWDCPLVNGGNLRVSDCQIHFASDEDIGTIVKTVMRWKREQQFLRMKELRAENDRSN